MKKNISYFYVEHNNVDKFLSGKEHWRTFSSYFRDYIFAVDDNIVVGFAILADSEKLSNKLKDVITLSDIFVLENYRHQGIASNLIEKALNKVLEKGKILRRTLPEPDGFSYIYDKISSSIDEKNILSIPYNLDFIFAKLNSDLFLENEYEVEEKFNIFDKCVDDFIAHLNKNLEKEITCRKNINSYLIDDFYSFLGQKNNLSKKNKPR